MLPIQLDVLRLLVWPLDLAADYSPQVVALNTSLTWPGVVGLVSMVSVAALGLLMIRRAPAVAFGILVALASYAPTSNLLFLSGVVLAERNLYLAVLAPALILGWLVDHSAGREYRRVLLAATAAMLLVFAGKSWARTPFWRTPQTSIIEEAGDHPESYRARLHLGDLLANHGRKAQALAEYLAADALAERDPFLGRNEKDAAIAVNRYDLAVDVAQHAYQLAPDDPRPARWLVEAALAARRGNMALEVATQAALTHPRSLGFAANYLFALEGVGGPPARRLLAAATVDLLSTHLVAAAARLDSVAVELNRKQAAPLRCEDVKLARETMEVLRPALLPTTLEHVGAGARRSSPDCDAATARSG
jgi:tetratricopeptide (TPR) repeat protein